MPQFVLQKFCKINFFLKNFTLSCFDAKKRKLRGSDFFFVVLFFHTVNHLCFFFPQKFRQIMQKSFTSTFYMLNFRENKIANDCIVTISRLPR